MRRLRRLLDVHVAAPEQWVCLALAILVGGWAQWRAQAPSRRLTAVEGQVCKLSCEQDELRDRIRNLEEQLSNQRTFTMPETARVYGEQPAAQAWDTMTTATSYGTWSTTWSN